MDLHPGRYPDESFKAYRKRRAAENKWVDDYLSALVPAAAVGGRRKMGKAAAKQFKRAKRLLRESRIVETPPFS